MYHSSNWHQIIVCLLFLSTIIFCYSLILGYEIILVFIHLSDVALNQARIAQRVREGGHHVLDEKVISRIPRTLKFIRKVLPLCDQVYILDA